MMTLINNTKTYAVVAATRHAPHIQDQKATGRPKGITVIGCSTTEVGAIKLTTDWSYQGTTGSPMGVAKAQKIQSQGDAKSMLRKALYEIFDIKEPIVTETKDPIKVNTLCFAGKYHCHSTASQVNHMVYKNSMQPQDNGHKYAPPPNKLMRSLECFHCHNVMILAPFFIFYPSHPLISCIQSLVSYSFPHIPLRPPPSHLTSHLMSHLTIMQSFITCYCSTVHSIII